MSANMAYTGSICCLPSSLQSGVSLVLTGGVIFLTIPSHCLEGEDVYWYTSMCNVSKPGSHALAYICPTPAFCEYPNFSCQVLGPT